MVLKFKTKNTIALLYESNKWYLRFELVIIYSPSSIAIQSLGLGSGGSGSVVLQGSSSAHTLNEQKAKISANNNIKNLSFIQPFCLFCFKNKCCYSYSPSFFYRILITWAQKHGYIRVLAIEPNRNSYCHLFIIYNIKEIHNRLFI